METKIGKDLAIVLGTVEIANLVGEEYFKSKIVQAAQSLTEPFNGEWKLFIGFESENNLWTVFGFVSIDTESGDTKVLDYRLPNGTRMENPLHRISRGAE